MTSFWRTYAVSTVLAAVSLPIILMAYLFASSALSGNGLPSVEAVVFFALFVLYLILPVAGGINLVVSAAWIRWRSSPGQPVLAVACRAALAGVVAGLLVCLGLRLL